MRNILKINDTTTVQNVKQGTFRYVQQVCEDGIGIRYGSTIASYIEAEAFYMSGGVTEVNEGDVIYYYQEDDVAKDFSPTISNTYKIGIFTVDKCIRGNNTYTFIAYDNIRKLDADYSARLLALKNQFPMRVKDFLDDIKSFMANLGVTIYTDSLNAYIYDDDMSPIYINYFYTNGITVRDIVSFFAEAEFIYWYVMPDGKIYFNSFALDSQASRDNNWYDADRYIISPTDQVTYTGSAVINGVVVPNATLIPVFYKENGLNHEGYSFAQIDGFHFYRTNGDEVYGDYSIPTQTNPYNIYNNLFADNTVSTGLYWADVCDTGYQKLQTTLNDYNITPFEVHLFPFRNPFSAGQIIPHIVDKDGNRISSVVMKMELTDYEVVLTCSGQEYYHDSSYGNYDTDSNMQSITALINGLQSDVDGKVSKSGDTMTGALEILSHVQPRSIELMPQTSSTNGGYIDFHFAGSSADYTSRIIERASGIVRLIGSLEISNPLAIAQGGTGATDVNGATQALHIYPRLNDTITSSQTLTITASATAVYLIFTSGNNVNNLGMYSVWVNTASSTPIVKTISSASNVTITTSAGKVMLKSTATLYVYVLCLHPSTYGRLTLTVANTP